MHPLADLGARLAAAGRFVEAEQALRSAPQDVLTTYNLGYVLRRLGRQKDAATVFRRVLKRDPRHFGALVNLANILHEAGDNRPAARLLADALRQQRTPELLCNLARVHRGACDLTAAIAAYEAALTIRPAMADARADLAIVRLMHGQWSLGFADYEARLFRADTTRHLRPSTLPQNRVEWAGSRVLIRWEQGFGDVIQFARYLTRLVEMGAEVTLECQPGLVRLLDQIAGVAVTSAADPTDYDAEAPLLSLPLLLGDDGPYCRGLYITAEPSPVVAGLDGFTVGLHWQGSPTYAYDGLRSFPARTFAPLAAVDGVSWVNFQFGPARDQMAEFPAPMIDAAAGFADFADTAAALAGIDLLITSDSAIAHLAGAMGRPVWLLVSKMGDWRWGTAGESTPWYPTVRVFRQDAQGDWSKPVALIKAALIEAARFPKRFRP